MKDSTLMQEEDSAEEGMIASRLKEYTGLFKDRVDESKYCDDGLSASIRSAIAKNCRRGDLGEGYDNETNPV